MRNQPRRRVRSGSSIRLGRRGAGAVGDGEAGGAEFGGELAQSSGRGLANAKMISIRPRPLALAASYRPGVAAVTG